MTHTPGPWALMRGGTLRGGMELKMVEYQDEYGEWLTLTRLECDLPDAFLIAAAPELLEALVDIVACSDANCGDSLANAIETARDVIAKARGE